jgi:hypothetical protein
MIIESLNIGRYHRKTGSLRSHLLQGLFPAVFLNRPLWFPQKNINAYLWSKASIEELFKDVVESLFSGSFSRSECHVQTLWHCAPQQIPAAAAEVLRQQKT